MVQALVESQLQQKNEQVKGFSLPLSIAPYKLQIIYKEEQRDKAFELYHKLLDNNINCIIDDREGYSIGNRINDTYVLGTPFLTVIGDRFDGVNIELEETKTGNKEIVAITEINNYFMQKEDNMVIN